MRPSAHLGSTPLKSTAVWRLAIGGQTWTPCATRYHAPMCNRYRVTAARAVPQAAGVDRAASGRRPAAVIGRGQEHTIRHPSTCVRFREPQSKRCRSRKGAKRTFTVGPLRNVMLNGVLSRARPVRRVSYDPPNKKTLLCGA